MINYFRHLSWFVSYEFGFNLGVFLSLGVDNGELFVGLGFMSFFVMYWIPAPTE